MSAWPGKYVLGLTGNIATGKSVVRKMLEHLGAYGIDADALAHRAMAQDAPGYRPIVELFGRRILAADGEIDRTRLGRVVFADAEALTDLEAILHPLVRQAIDALARRARHPAIVIEAIKLLEGPLRQACDSVWVTSAPPEIQLVRLVQKRGLSAEAARQRIDAQPPQEDKLLAADVIIYTDGSFERVWNQVVTAWQNTVAPHIVQVAPVMREQRGLLVEHAGPRQAGEIASFITRLSKGRRAIERGDIMAAFGERAFLLLRKDGSLAGLAGWQVENLVARTSEVYLEPGLSYGEAMRVMMGEIERASGELLCEISLVFLPPHLARHEAVWAALGYEIRQPRNLGVRAWEEAALESMPAGTVLLFKQLRKDRILQPV
jgi:dephospho-CoA kinase